MHDWFAAHPIIAYLIIYVFLVYIFNKVFRVRKLPILKDMIIYVLIGICAFVLLVFQIDKLPIIPCLAVAVALMLMVRIRYFVEARQKRKEAAAGQPSAEGK
ncbi:hypothetical protein BVG16_11205 [Paenibacillus selenitireducens]|uniref:YlaH-like protein n=1 Tax=Paenibacillus selenitireducens TaxID=1324314 RepID=A0A1T2XG00_9BACL|nr:YlaH-like family protein [Paenibacillus selenitireducens]OPA78768.1 hypothetical protein BVG16_11205 [Paenibacillus selenitireducens]